MQDSNLLFSVVVESTITWFLTHQPQNDWKAGCLMVCSYGAQTIGCNLWKQIYKEGKLTSEEQDTPRNSLLELLLAGKLESKNINKEITKQPLFQNCDLLQTLIPFIGVFFLKLFYCYFK